MDEEPGRLEVGRRRGRKPMFVLGELEEIRRAIAFEVLDELFLFARPEESAVEVAERITKRC